MDVIKTVGSSGQISLGKKFAGQTVILSELDPGVWLVKVGRFVPDNEKWLHAPEVKDSLDSAIDWAEKNPPSGSDLHELEKQMK